MKLKYLFVATLLCLSFVNYAYAWSNDSLTYCRQVTITDSSSQARVNYPVTFFNLNLSGAATNMGDIVVYSDTCQGNGMQYRISTNGSWDGFNSKDLYNITALVNLSSGGSLTLSIYYGNKSTFEIPQRDVIIYDNFSTTTGFWTSQEFTSSAYSVTGGEAVLTTARAAGSWFSNQTGNVRVFSNLNYAKGFSVSCEVKWTRQGSGSEMSCGAFKEPDQNGYTQTITGVTNFDDNSDLGIKQSVAQAEFGSNLDGATPTSYINTSVWINGTTAVSHFYTIYNGTTNGMTAMSVSQSRNKVGIMATARTAGDTPSFNVKWICAVDKNETCSVYEGTNTTVSISAAQEKTDLAITITSPANVTHLNHTQLLNFSFNSGRNTSALCSVQLDSGSFTSLGQIANNTANVTIQTFNSDGLHNITVLCNNNFVNATSTVWFTLFAQNYLYFFDQTTFISGFNVYSAASGINRTASGIFFNVSSDNLTAGSNTFILTTTSYFQNSTIITVNRTIGFNVTVNTTQTAIIFQALDEVSLQQLGFSMNMFLKGTNTTLINAVAFRNGKSCFYDTDETTSCLAVTATEGGSGQTLTANTSTIQGYGQNIATYKIIWDVTNNTGGGGTKSGLIKIMQQNGTVLFTETQNAPAVPTVFTSYFTMDNRFGYYSGVDNLTVQVSATAAGAIADTVTTTIRELRIVNNSAGYVYASNTNNTISVPSIYTLGFTTVDAWFSGASETLMPDYITPRMYRLSFSSVANYQLTTYLLNQSVGYLQYFTVLDPNNVPVTNVLITIQNWYSGVATTVVQCASNPTGSCAVFVKRYIEYQLTGQLTGYTTIQRAVVFTGLPNPANLYMNGNINANYTSVFTGISIAITPGVENQNQSFNTTCSITSSIGNLNFMNYTIYRIENNTFFQYNSTYSASVSTGSAFKMPILAKGRYSAVCTLQWVSNATGTTTTYQTSYTQPYWNYQDPAQGIGAPATDTMMGLGIYILAILVICLPLSRFSPGLAALAGIGILMAAAFTEIFSWNTLLNGVPANLGWYLAGLVILVLIAVFSLRNRV